MSLYLRHGKTPIPRARKRLSPLVDWLRSIEALFAFAVPRGAAGLHAHDSPICKDASVVAFNRRSAALRHVAARLALIPLLTVSSGCEDRPRTKGLDAVCERLMAAKVARECPEVVHDSLVSYVEVRAAAIDGVRVLMCRYELPADLERLSAEPEGVPADDYPRRRVSHPPSRTLVVWANDNYPDSEAVRWARCRQRETVAVCAAAQPAYYAATKAIFEAAHQALGMK